MLIVARAVQGLGGAVVAPATLAIITTTFAEGYERNRALGYWGAMGAVGGSTGVLLGGVLTQLLGWQWILFINVPVGILGRDRRDALHPGEHARGRGRAPLRRRRAR